MIDTAKKYLFIICGSFSVALGVIGIFIPVLPTTPFFLLAAFLYLRSSEKLYCMLIRHKVFGAYIHNYITYRAVLRSTKIGAIAFLWTGLVVSMFIIDNWYVRAALIFIGICVSVHLLTLKTIKKSEFIAVDHEDENIRNI